MRLQAEDVECRECEDCSCHDNTRRSTYRLNDNIFAEHTLLLATNRADTCRQDCDRNSRLEHLSHLQTEEGCRSREDDSHNNTHSHRVWRSLGRGALCRHHRLVLLARLQLTIGIFGQRDVFLLFHITIIFRLIFRVQFLVSLSIILGSCRWGSCRGQPKPRQL